MLDAIRKIAQKVDNTLTTCLNPMCLHSKATRDPKCSCCRKGCGAKRKPVRKSAKAKRR
jgi:hypothetical protein